MHGLFRGPPEHLRVNRALTGPLPALQDRDRKYPCPTVVRDQVCFPRHPDPPSTLLRMQGTDSSWDRAAGTPHVSPSAMPNTWEYGKRRSDCDASKPNLPALQNPEPVAYKNWWWAR